MPATANRPVGFLCQTVDEYADTIRHVLVELDDPARWRIAEAARAAAGTRFTEARFAARLAQAIDSTAAIAQAGLSKLPDTVQ